MRILLVEDHTDTRVILTFLLRQRGNEVFAAESISAARVLANDQVIDILISDIGLPDGYGWDLLRELGGKIPCAIALSGFNSPADLRRSHNEGFRRHLVKPIDPDELWAAITEASETSIA